MIKEQNNENEKIVSCDKCRNILFSGCFVGYQKLKCSKCNTMFFIEINKQGVITMARQPPINLQVVEK